MSKIIKEGELPGKRVKCDYCGCEFEYDKRDVSEERQMPDYVPYSAMPLSMIINYGYFVACPYCHTTHKLPADILDQLKSANPIKNFADDAQALAAQYGLEIEEIKLKD